MNTPTASITYVITQRELNLVAKTSQAGRSF